LWKSYQYGQRYEITGNKRHNPFEDLFDGYLRTHAFKDIDINPYGRRDLPDLYGPYCKDAKKDGAELKGGNDREEEGDAENNHGQGIHEAAHDEVDNHDDGQDNVSVHSKARYPGGD